MSEMHVTSSIPDNLRPQPGPDVPRFYYPEPVVQPELSAPQHEAGDKKNRFAKTKRLLGGVAAAGVLVSVLSPDQISNPDQNRAFTSATEAVQPAGQEYYAGLPQAEQFFDEPTLDRTRAAIEAYMAGDSAELANQQIELGYESSWVSIEAVGAVESATNTDELEAAFDVALEGLPVTLDIVDSEDMLGDLSKKKQHTLASDLESDKALALAAIDTFNLFDKDDLVENLQPLKYAVVGSIKNLDDGSSTGVAGYHKAASHEGQVGMIVVAESSADDDGLVAHELTHQIDKTGSRDLDFTVDKLNLDNFSYDENNEELKIDGWNNVQRGYGNTNKAEDVATIGEDMLRETPTIALENSPLGEKTMAVLLTLEERSPGFSASLLSRTPPQEVPSRVGEVIDSSMNSIIENKKLIGGVSGLILGALAAVGAARILGRRK